MSRLREMLIRHEGLRLNVGISREEALLLLDHDIARVRHEAGHAFAWFPDLDPVMRRGKYEAD